MPTMRESTTIQISVPPQSFRLQRVISWIAHFVNAIATVGCLNFLTVFCSIMFSNWSTFSHWKNNNYVMMDCWYATTNVFLRDSQPPNGYVLPIFVLQLLLDFFVGISGVVLVAYFLTRRSCTWCNTWCNNPMYSVPLYIARHLSVLAMLQWSVAFWLGALAQKEATQIMFFPDLFFLSKVIVTGDGAAPVRFDVTQWLQLVTYLLEFIGLSLHLLLQLGASRLFNITVIATIGLPLQGYEEAAVATVNPTSFQAGITMSTTMASSTRVSSQSAASASTAGARSKNVIIHQPPLPGRPGYA